MSGTFCLVIQAPTLILHRVRTEPSPSRPGAARRSTSAALGMSSCPGDDHLLDLRSAETRIRRDPTRSRDLSPARDQVPIRIACSSPVMFTDIVSSTERAATPSVTDGGGTLSTDISAVARRQLERFRGREIDVAGDGLLYLRRPRASVRCACAIRDRQSTRAGLGIGRGFTGNARSRDHGSAASPCIPARESPRQHTASEEVWHRRWSGTSWQPPAHPLRRPRSRVLKRCAR